MECDYSMTIIYDPRTPPATPTQAAIHLSVRVSDRLRVEVGSKGDVLTLWPQLPRMFKCADELAEAQRLLELAARIRKQAVNELPELFGELAEAT